MKEKLAEIRKALKALVALGENITDEQAEKLADLNKQAVKFEALVAAEEQSARAEKENEARIVRERDEAVAAARAEEAAKARRLVMGDGPYVKKFGDVDKYDNLDAVETALVIDTLNSQGKRVSGAAFKALSLKVGKLKNRSNTEEEEKSLEYMRNNFESFTGIKSDMSSVESAVKAATDPMYTGGSGIGSDWVGTQYSSEIWRAIRGANVVVSRVPSTVIPDGYSSTYFPLEGADPTWYKTAEVTASDSTMKVPAATVTASQAATANKQITVGKISARVLYSGEMVEDSLIPFAAQLREQMQISGAEIIEHLFIDGDVETSANKNINDIAGTPAATDVFLTLDGFRKLALVTNTANSRSASGAFVVADFKDTLKLMGTAGIAGADPTKVAFILDYNTMWAALELPELKTKDTFNLATIENGFLTRIYNTPVLYAFQMHRTHSARKANTAGKIDLDTDGNNTTGALLAVRFDQWKQAYKRRMTMETTRIPNADAWEVTAHCRLGLAYRDSEAAAISYNVGI
jgi:HK97 family phage major capsid protein